MPPAEVSADAHARAAVPMPARALKFTSKDTGSRQSGAVLPSASQGKRILISPIAIHGRFCNKGTTSVGPPRKHWIIRALAPANLFMSPLPLAGRCRMQGLKPTVLPSPMCGPTEVVPLLQSA